MLDGRIPPGPEGSNGSRVSVAVGRLATFRPLGEGFNRELHWRNLGLVGNDRFPDFVTQPY